MRIEQISVIFGAVYYWQFDQQIIISYNRIISSYYNDHALSGPIITIPQQPSPNSSKKPESQDHPITQNPKPPHHHRTNLTAPLLIIPNNQSRLAHRARNYTWSAVRARTCQLRDRKRRSRGRTVLKLPNRREWKEWRKKKRIPHTWHIMPRARESMQMTIEKRSHVAAAALPQTTA